jgi:hypothetical protein
MITFKFGKQKRKGDTESFAIGQLEGALLPGMVNWSLEDFAKQLAKQCGVRRGEIKLHSITFTYGTLTAAKKTAQKR